MSMEALHRNFRRTSECIADGKVNPQPACFRMDHWTRMNSVCFRFPSARAGHVHCSKGTSSVHLSERRCSMRDLSATPSIEGFAREVESKERLDSMMAATMGSSRFYIPAIGKQHHSVIVLSHSVMPIPRFLRTSKISVSSVLDWYRTLSQYELVDTSISYDYYRHTQHSLIDKGQGSDSKVQNIFDSRNKQKLQPAACQNPCGLYDEH
ncbi:hypothetical protein DFS33DRAFT_795959 [Desarmillaria ectypa]|nr:hypothetical protein DFS33DRAFT_795959 [Desarmillaria ectypa]